MGSPGLLGALAASSVCVLLALVWLLTHSLGPTRRSGNTLRRPGLPAGVVGPSILGLGWLGRRLGTDMFLASAKASFNLVFIRSVQATGTAAGAPGWLMSPCQCQAPLRCWPKGPRLVLAQRLVDCGVSAAARGSLGRASRQTAEPRDGPAFFAVATPWYALAAQPMAWPFLGGFFGFQQSGALHLRCCTATPGLGTSICLGACCCCLPVASIGPLPCQGPRLLAAGAWWRKATQTSQLAPFLPGLVPVVYVCFFSAAATKLLAYIAAAVPAGSAA